MAHRPRGKAGMTLARPFLSEKRRTTRYGSLGLASEASAVNPGMFMSGSIWIVFLNDLFYGPELYRRTGRDVKFFLMDENPLLCRSARSESSPDEHDESS